MWWNYLAKTLELKTIRLVVDILSRLFYVYMFFFFVYSYANVFSSGSHVLVNTCDPTLSP